MIHRECLDFGSDSYVNVFANSVVLYVHDTKVKEFDSFNEAFDYWYNHFCS